MSTNKNEDKKLDHVYDDIEELDNALPKWWLGILYGTIAFSAAYYLYYEVGSGPSLIKEYEEAKATVAATTAAQAPQSSGPTEDSLLAVANEPARKKAGKDVFMGKCAACHGPEGQGAIGPNLTDKYWLHGGKLTQIYNTIAEGVADKGMPPWKALLKDDEMQSVVAYIRSIKDTNPAGAKAPQGNLEN